MKCARCDWQPDRTVDTSERAQLAEHATIACHPLCIIDGRSLRGVETQTCDACLATTRTRLAEIVSMYDELPRHLGHARAQVYDTSPRGGGSDRPLPGGTVLALLAPGGTGNAARKLTRSDIEQGKDGREHAIDNAPDDAPSVAWMLASWEDDWRNTRGEPAAVVPGGPYAVVQAAAGYLERHALWAAQHHSAFDEYDHDLLQLHVTLERTTGRVRNERDAGARCFDCRAGELVHPVDEKTGLEDEVNVVCRTCHAVYDPARFALALRLAVESASRTEIDGEAYATATVIARGLGRSENTVKTWAREQIVRSSSVRGVLYVSVTDADEADATRGRRKRSA